MALRPGSRLQAPLFPAGDILINDVLIVLKQVAHTHRKAHWLTHRRIVYVHSWRQIDVVMRVSFCCARLHSPSHFHPPHHFHSSLFHTHKYHI